MQTFQHGQVILASAEAPATALVSRDDTAETAVSSCGRNLLCVYSKKHINDVPESAEMKKKANARTLREMTGLLRYRCCAN